MHTIVLGAGVIGLVSALALDRLGNKVTVLERQTLPLRPSLRTLALSPQSLALLATLDLMPALDPVLGNYDQMHVWVHDAPQRKLAFNAYDYGMDRLGAVVSVDALLEILNTAIIERGIAVKSACSVLHLEEYQQRVIIQLEHTSIQADFLVVAEGPKTPLADFLGLQRQYFASPHQAITGILATERPHYNVASQIFHLAGPFALLPCVASHQISFVYSIDKTMPVIREALDFAELTQGILGEVELISELEIAPIQSQSLVHYGYQRVWCVGDSVQVVPPIAGLGVNLGLGALETLLEQVPALQQGTISYSSGLRAYEAACRIRMKGVHHALAGLIGVTQDRSAGLQLFGWLLEGVDKLPLLKKVFAQHATGKGLYK